MILQSFNSYIWLQVISDGKNATNARTSKANMYVVFFKYCLLNVVINSSINLRLFDLFGNNAELGEVSTIPHVS